MNSTGATRALTILEAHLGADHPNIATLVDNLGKVLQDLGDLAGARAHLSARIASAVRSWVNSIRTTTEKAQRRRRTRCDI